MSENPVVANPAPAETPPAHWPAPAPAVAPALPVREAAAKRAAESQNPRDLAEYLRLRRK